MKIIEMRANGPIDKNQVVVRDEKATGFLVIAGSPALPGALGIAMKAAIPGEMVPVAVHGEVPK